MRNTDITVAVTGAAGFLGSHICRALLRCGYAVRAVTRQGSSRKFPDDLSGQVELRPADVRNVESLNAVFRDVHAVVHNAAIVTTEADPEGLVRAVNLTGTRNAIEACVDNGVSRLVHISSTHAFSPLRGRVLDADSQLELHSKIPYTTAKAEAHISVLKAARSGRIKRICHLSFGSHRSRRYGTHSRRWPVARPRAKACPMPHRRGILVERRARCGECGGECGGDEYRQWRGLFSCGAICKAH